MKVGVGYCNNPDALHSGRAAATEALRNGALQKPDFAIAFCSGQLDHDKFLQGIRNAIGEIPVIGGSSIGIITNDHLSYTDVQTGVAVFQCDDIRYQITSAGELNKNERVTGASLASQLSESEDDTLLLMFYDSIKVPAFHKAPPSMNASMPLIEGIESKLQSKPLIFGAGVIGDFLFRKSEQFCGSSVKNQNAVGALLSGSMEIYHTIMHGCSPLDGIYHTITKMQGSVVYELDGLPIVEVIDELYGDQEWRKQQPLSILTLGVNHGERFSYQEDRYVNRLITGVLPDGSGIGMFEPDLAEGSEIQFMLRDSSKMIASAKHNSENLMEKVLAEGKSPVFALYIDCAGRTAEQSNTVTEEAEEVQKVMKKYATPLLGFYSGVEVAPVFGKSRGLDWTGVLMVIAEDK